jgi:hypothetical protein
MLMNGAQVPGMSMNLVHHGHHVTMDGLNINPAALLYSPTGAMMRVSAGVLAPNMMPPSAVLPPHSPPSSMQPLTGLMSPHDSKDHKHSLSYDDSGSLGSGDEGGSDSSEGPRKRRYL